LEIALDHSNKSNAEAQKSIKKYLQVLKENQSNLEEEIRLHEELREEYGTTERRAHALSNELEESRTLFEQADRARRITEQELFDAREQLNELGGQVSNLGGLKRKLEGQLQALHTDLEEILNEAKNSEEKAKKAMVDAARLADELRVEQEYASGQERTRKELEAQAKELQSRLEIAERDALKGSQKIIAKLETRLRGLEQELDSEQRSHANAQKNLRKGDRRVKELTFQAEEDRKNYEKMQDLVDKLQGMLKTYKRQIEEAEEIAALNLAKFTKTQQELEEAYERTEAAEFALQKMRTGGGGAGPRGMSRGPSVF